MKDKWKETTLGDVCNIKHGYGFKGEYFSDFPTKNILLTPGNFNIGGGFKSDKLKYYDGPIPDEFILKSGDIIVTMTDLSKEGDTLGYSAKIPHNPNLIYLHNQRIGLINDITENVDSDFLYWLLRNKEYQYYVVSTATGSTVRHTSPKTIKKYKFKIPPINIQKNIGQLLNSIEEKIELNSEINNNLEQLAESIFKNWFVKCEPFKNENFIEHSWTNFPESWKLIRLKDIIHITSGKRPGDKQDLKKDKFIYPLYGASSIMGYVSEYSYNEPILLIGRVGTLGIVQRVLDKCHPSDNTLVIKSKYYEYIFQILKRINYDSYNTGSTQPLITQKAINNIEIPLPPQKELDKFEKISSTLYSEVYKNKNEIETLTKLRDTLIPKLMSGEIDVSNINFDLE